MKEEIEIKISQENGQLGMREGKKVHSMRYKWGKGGSWRRKRKTNLFGNWRMYRGHNLRLEGLEEFENIWGI